MILRSLSRPAAAAFALAFASAAVPACAPAAGTALPATPVGRHAAAWFAAFNTGDPAVLAAFTRAHVAPEDLAARPLEQRLANFRRMRDELGDLVPLEVLEDDPDRLDVRARPAKSDEPVVITFLAKEGAPQWLRGIRVEQGGPGEGPRGEGGPPMSEAALADSIDAFLARPGDGAFSGVVHVVDGGREVFSKAYGLADRAAGTPNTTSTRFNIGSIDKVFTKVAIGQLAVAGRLSLDDRLSKHLPDYPRAIADRITIGQLVEHTSGLGDIFGPQYDAMDKSRLRTLADFLPLFRDRPLAFEPGSESRYSNAGYVVLGLVIERLAGVPYAEYVKRHVFAPLGMTATGPSVAGANGPGVAVGYTTRGVGHGPRGEERENTASLPGHSSSAGGGLSSAADLVRFAHGLRAGALLPAAHVAWVAGGPWPAPGAPAPAGGPEGALGIAGGAPGLNATLHVWFDSGRALVVLANHDPPAAESRARKIAGWVRRTKLPAS